MSENILIHDPARTRLADCSYCSDLDLPLGTHDARALGTPVIMHGLAPWMLNRGLDYGPDGYLVIAVCATHAAEREVLGVLNGRDINSAKVGAFKDHAPPDPVPPPATLEEAIERSETMEELRAAVLELARREPR